MQHAGAGCDTVTSERARDGCGGGRDRPARLDFRRRWKSVGHLAWLMEPAYYAKMTQPVGPVWRDRVGVVGVPLRAELNRALAAGCVA